MLKLICIKRDDEAIISSATSLDKEKEKGKMCEAIRQIRADGGFKMLDTLIREHYLTVEQAAAAMGMTKEEVLKGIEKVRDTSQLPPLRSRY